MDVSNIFLGGGEESQAPGRGGGRFFIEDPRREGGGGGFSHERGEGEGPGGRLRGIWGGGANIFFRGRNPHQEDKQAQNRKKWTNWPPINRIFYF